jgi:hypothetical protein
MFGEAPLRIGAIVELAQTLAERRYAVNSYFPSIFMMNKIIDNKNT